MKPSMHFTTVHLIIINAKSGVGFNLKDVKAQSSLLSPSVLVAKIEFNSNIRFCFDFESKSLILCNARFV